MQPLTSRRNFLKTTALGTTALGLTATSYGKVAGANERLSIGIIGCGSRGRGALMTGVNNHAKEQNIEITAVADPWRQQRERAAATCEQWYGRAARSFVSYRNVVDLDDVDAVMIGSCDHQHTLHMEAAAKAKKDIYCEKPLAMDFERLKTACDAVRENDLVFQAGTQVRSWPTSTACREFYKSGALGVVSRIEQHRNAPRPYWYGYLQDAHEQDVDWQEFLMDRPARPFRADLFTGWYGYRDFSDGPVPGLGSHFIDLVHFVTGATFPVSSLCQGGTHTWIDQHEFTCPDHVQATWIYPEGFMVSYTTNFGNGYGNRLCFYGDQGLLNLSPWNRPAVSSAGTGAGKESSLPAEEEPLEPIPTPDHFLDWLQCLRSRRACNASIDAGYQHAVAVIMAMKAFDTGQRHVYDAEARTMQPG